MEGKVKGNQDINVKNLRWNKRRMENTNEKKGLNISVKSFITAIAVLFVLMIMTYVLTFIVPGGEIPFWKSAL